MIKKLFSWMVYAAFAVVALVVSWHDELWLFSGPQGAAKAMIWLAFLGFLGYSLYCSSQENIFRSISQILRLHWGRQISLDLYIGLALFMGLVYLHQGSLLVVALWFLPVLLFANLATFLYVLIHFESLQAVFIG